MVRYFTLSIILPISIFVEACLITAHALDINFSKRTSVICEVQTKWTGTLPSAISTDVSTNAIVLEFSNSHIRQKSPGPRMDLRCKDRNCRIDSVEFYDDDDCMYSGLWNCKSRIKIVGHELFSELVGSDGGKKISQYARVEYRLRLNLKSGEINYSTSISSNLFPFRLMPPIASESSGRCR
jgi:hypothetical protein